MGRALPGTAEVKVAAYDVGQRRLVTEADGLGRECGVGEAGLLVARVNPASQAHDIPLRSVFTRDDAWQSTGDLFTRDKDGDLWLVDRLDSLISTPSGPVSPSSVRNALGSVPAVDLAVAYGVSVGECEVVVGAVTLLPGSQMARADLESAMRSLAADHRPAYVQVVRELPVTTWARPLLRPLRERGVPEAVDAEAVWRLASDGQSYELLERA
jgi:putative long chain acyl-CoA synthase